MRTSTSKIGDYLIAIDYDESLRLFRGSIINKRYPVRLSAQSADELERKFQRLLNNYLGAQAA